ncbi:MAG: hypothetical protein H6830_12030 [Planctomycetes bacterium]|nr:hypothetical protein [Planctomycetota bacterium]HPF12783.1 hypothetical protein [Planctomycetota bacterium]
MSIPISQSTRGGQMSVPNTTRILLLVTVVAAILSGLWVTLRSHSTHGGEPSPLEPNSHAASSIDKAELKERDSMLQDSHSDVRADVSAPEAANHADSVGDLFPYYGDQELLPGIAIRDLPNVDLSPEEVSAAVEKLHLISDALTQEVYRHIPEVRNSFITLDEAIEKTAQGFLVMQGNDPWSEGGTRFFICPDSRAAQLNELKTAGLLIYHSPQYIQKSSESIRMKALNSPRGKGNLLLEVRSDGSGIDIWNDKEEPVIWKRFSIPGIATGFLPPKR